MKIKIEKKYLVLPTNVNAKQKDIRFFENGKERYFLNMRLDTVDPDFYAYIEMSRFLGKELDVEIFPQMDLPFLQADEIEFDGEDALRPDIHFTAKRGWINDPNGLIYLNGEYHLFYQYNPAAREWYNAHWGHAVSKDLLHWEDRPIALYPDELGFAFSGTAIVDENNLLGLQTGEEKTVLLYYTAAGNYAPNPKPYTQCLAYSTDGLQTVEKYTGNPILGKLETESRDPSVHWCEERNQYVMALYLDNDVYGLFVSDDLVSWTELQRFKIEGENECPNFFPMKDEEGNKKWVFIGAHDIYLIGEFRGGEFCPLQEPKSLCKETDAYASQVFANMPNDRIVRMAWGRWNRLKAKTFSGQLTIPCDVKLEKSNGEYYLSTLPIPELERLIKNKQSFEKTEFHGKKEIVFSIENAATEIRVNGNYQKTSNFTLSIFGVTLSFDFDKNECKPIYYSVVSKEWQEGEHKNLLSINQENFDVRIIADHSGVEVFCDNGKISFMIIERAVCDGNFPYVKFNMEDPSRPFESVTLITYDRTWRKNQ
ncbi:MAG: glycoside hydrolase family 32 protein [Clostridia bacterium]|nr:glycoside hydrolase family 32 protein [Clostridia bacterium]